MVALPLWCWVALYYVAVVVIYRFLLYGYLTEVLDRHIMGLADTFMLTAVLAGYLLLVAIPPFLWSRKSYYHPVWRGIESFICYLLVALVLGAIFAAADGGDWSLTSGIAAGGAAWARIGSVIVLLAVLIAASWLGGKTAAGRRRLVKSKKRRKRTKGDDSA